MTQAPTYLRQNKRAAFKISWYIPGIKIIQLPLKREMYQKSLILYIS